MVLDEVVISDRNLNFKLNRINWLDQEITRYRDYEWTSTSFHTAFFVAILYLLIIPDTRQNLINAVPKIFIAVIILLYVIIASLQLKDVHKKLEKSWKKRDKFLEEIGEPYRPEGTKNFPYTEFFIIWLIILFIFDLYLLFKPYLCYTT